MPAARGRPARQIPICSYPDYKAIMTAKRLINAAFDDHVERTMNMAVVAVAEATVHLDDVVKKYNDGHTSTVNTMVIDAQARYARTRAAQNKRCREDMESAYDAWLDGLQALKALPGADLLAPSLFFTK